MHILFINPQGNFDPEDRYWTEHPDFGGQLVYVKEIALAMSELGHTVDIVTRRFNDAELSGFESTIDHYKGYPNARIVRIEAGPNQFVEKEKLWPLLRDWVNNIIAFYQEEGTSIDFITTHYGDGGYAGALLASQLKVPYSFTGHSLGAQKMDKLQVSKSNAASMQARYFFADRLMAERIAIQNASLIFTSTAQEKDEQYNHIAYQDISKEKPDAFVVAAPGVNERVFGMHALNPEEEQTYAQIKAALDRDIQSARLDLPYIVLASRLDQKKNHLGLLEAYAKDVSLQAKANIAISLRGVEDAFSSYDALKNEEKVLMDQLMHVIDTHHLKGMVSFINIMSQGALAASYRYFAKQQSVFCLTSTYEPFGLAPIEAMCAGLPAAVTKYGGPADVLKSGAESFGVLLDVNDPYDIARGLHEIINHHATYQAQGLKRVETSYTWKATARKYLESMDVILSQYKPNPFNWPNDVPAQCDAMNVLNMHYLGGHDGTSNQT
jgi:sucrose-phosphate synthase